MTYILSGLSRHERQQLATDRAEQVQRYLRTSDLAVAAYRAWKAQPETGRPEWSDFYRDFRAKASRP